MEAYCCCSVAHQPSSAGEKELFTSSTATMPSTSMTMKSTQRMIVVVIPPFNVRDRVRVVVAHFVTIRLALNSTF